MKRLAFAILLGLATLASARPLKGMMVQIDGETVSVGIPYVELSTYRLDLARVLPALTGGHVSLRKVGAMECRIVVDGQDRVSLSLNPGDTVARPLPSGVPFEITESPQLLKTPEGQRIYLDLRALGQLTGVSATVEDKALTLLTPEWWAARLGISAERRQGLNGRTIGHTPDFGITPPAKTMLLWVRPDTPSWIQIFKGLPGVPAPMLAINTRDKPVVNPLPSDSPTMWQASFDTPVQAPTEHDVLPDGGVAFYGAVVAPRDLGEDPVAAINGGGVEGWMVVGARQRALPSPMSFRMVEFRSGETLGSFAVRTRMPVELLLAMNGYGQRGRPRPHTRLIVIDNVIPVAMRRTDPKVTGLYEVKADETVDGLAKRWGVSTAALCKLNDDLEAADELVPGQVIFQVAPGEKPIPPKQRITATERPGSTKFDVALLQTSSKGAKRLTDIPKGELVAIRGRLDAQGLYVVQYGEGDDCLTGYVPIAAIRVQPDPPTSSPLSPTESSLAAAIRREALAHLGTPYNWGGNDIARGIDCSHFVAAVLARSGAARITPPVSSQEMFGTPNHWKPGTALRGRGTITFREASPSLNRLSIGDRLIIQHPPINQRAGGRHTGVYIGRYDGPFGHIPNAVVHAGSHGVAVVPFTYLWRDYRYTLHDNLGRRTQSAPAKKEWRFATRRNRGKGEGDG